MAQGKQQVRTIVDSLPEDLTVDQVMEELRFRLMVEETFKELHEHTEADSYAAKWIQK